MYWLQTINAHTTSRLSFDDLPMFTVAFGTGMAAISFEISPCGSNQQSRILLPRFSSPNRDSLA